MTPGPLQTHFFPRALRARRRATRERATRGGDTLCELFDNHSGSGRPAAQLAVVELSEGSYTCDNLRLLYLLYLLTYLLNLAFK